MNQITFRDDAKADCLDILHNGRLAANVFKDKWGRKGYIIMATSFYPNEVAARIEDRTFDSINEVKAYATAWLSSQNPDACEECGSTEGCPCYERHTWQAEIEAEDAYYAEREVCDAMIEDGRSITFFGDTGERIY